MRMRTVAAWVWTGVILVGCWLPGRWLVRTKFDNLAKIARCAGPVLIAHGTADNIVPFAQGERLFAAANEPKGFVPLPGEGQMFQLGPEFFKTLKELVGRPGGRPAGGEAEEPGHEKPVNLQEARWRSPRLQVSQERLRRAASRRDGRAALALARLASEQTADQGRQLELVVVARDHLQLAAFARLRHITGGDDA